MAQPPIAAAFQTQRTALESAKTAADLGLQFQQSIVDAYVGGLESTKALQASGVDVSKRTTEAWLDALETTVPESVVAQLREAVEEGYTAVEKNHAAGWEEFEAAIEAYQDVADDVTATQRSLIEESIDDLVSAQSEAEAAVVEATEAIESVVAEAQDAVEDVVDE